MNRGIIPPPMLKPANIKVRYDGAAVKVLDFGLAGEACSRRLAAGRRGQGSGDGARRHSDGPRPTICVAGDADAPSG